MAEPVKIETFQLDAGLSRIRVEGSLSSLNIVRLEAAIQGVFARGIYRLVVNLKGATSISSEGLGCFISAHLTAIKNGGRVILAATPSSIKDAFNLVGLSNVLSFADSEGRAREEWGR